MNHPRNPTLNTQFDGPEVSPGFLLWQVTNSWQAQQRAALKPFGLTHVQFVLLASLVWLQSDEEPITQKYLAQHTNIDVMMTSEVVRTLEKKNLLHRSPHPQDNRAVILTASESAVALINQAIIAVEAVDQQLFGQLGEELPEFVTALQTLWKATYSS